MGKAITCRWRRTDARRVLSIGLAAVIRRKPQLRSATGPLKDVSPPFDADLCQQSFLVVPPFLTRVGSASVQC